MSIDPAIPEQELPEEELSDPQQESYDEWLLTQSPASLGKSLDKLISTKTETK
jgi:hypothetical protein